MIFTKLYIYGFKSFADKTVINLSEGVTAVVGPNGSGKSNIMDAMRWVIGEQNPKELRGSDMEDIIFNGSEKRKASGFAEAALTISDVSEEIAAKYGSFSEITVARKLYKSGEREYLINNRRCRLRDIREIFMDTGLGSRSIAIIEQGRISGIINSSPEELRYFIEETAGVVKFKDRKKNALARISQVNDNIARLNDIISEVKARRDILAAQADTLKKAEKLQNEKRRCEKTLLASLYKKKISEARAAEEEIKTRKDNLTLLIGEFNKYLNKEREAESLYSEKEKDISEIQEKRISAVKNAAKSESAISSLKEKISSSEALRKQWSEDIIKSDGELKEISEKILLLKKGAEESEKKLAALKEEDKKKEDELSALKKIRDEEEKELKEENGVYIKIAGTLTELRNRLIRLETEESHRQKDAERLKKEKEYAEKNIAQWENNLNETKARFKNISDLYIKIQEDLKIIKKEREEARLLRDGIRIKKSGCESALKSIRKNISFFEEELNSSVFPKEGDILRKFSPVLLSEKISDLNNADALRLGGTVLFEKGSEEEIIKKVNSLKSPLSFTFPSCLEDIKRALKDNSSEEISECIYKRDGIYYKSGQEDRGEKINRLKKRIEEEREKESEAAAAFNIHVKESEAAERKLSLKEKDFFTLNNDYEDKKGEYFTLKSECEKTAETCERIKRRIGGIGREYELALSNADDIKRKLLSLKEDAENKEREREEINAKCAEFEKRLKITGKELEAAKEESSRIKIALSAAEAEHSALKREYRALDERMKKLKERRDDLSKKLSGIREEASFIWEEEIKELYKKLSEYNKDVIYYESELKGRREELENIGRERSEAKKEREECNERVKKAEGGIKNKEVALAAANSFISLSEEQFSEKYGESLATLYEELAEDNIKPEKMKADISRYEKEIEELGAINLNAFNEYEEADGRFQFLSGQKSDLETSLNNITAFIEEIDGETAEMFKETFDAVRKNFKDVFHILFGDGEAELRLTEPDNLLKTGVEMYIQPPGKRLQSMGLLSGGEKALAAMTLLFALFLRKPAPFCFLDEVDAPLDYANAARYTEIVKSLSDRIQFMLITHNHNTMAEASSLYGVTMEEKGVSKLLAVKLKDVK